MPDEFPKWVKPDPSHVVKHNGNQVTPSFPHFNVARNGEVTVLVNNKDEEKKALASVEKERPASVEKERPAVTAERAKAPAPVEKEQAKPLSWEKK